jgi:hypothetical protein
MLLSRQTFETLRGRRTHRVTFTMQTPNKPTQWTGQQRRFALLLPGR